MVGIGHVGTRYATDVALQFQAELAVAHAAVATVLPEDFAEKNELLPLSSQVTTIWGTDGGGGAVLIFTGR